MDELRLLGEIVKSVGIPALVICFYIWKEMKQGDKIVAAMLQMVSVGEKMVASNATMVMAIGESNRHAAETATDISDIRLIMGIAKK